MRCIVMIIQFWASFSQLYIEMVPYLAFGLIVAGILHVLVKKSFILNHFGKSGIGSVIKAAILGVPLPLCSCSVVPTALSLKKHGASSGATLSFLISTPQTGVESIAATWGMMGPFFALFRPFVAFVTGILGGVITTQLDNSPAVDITKIEETKGSSLSFIQKIKELFRYGFVELMDDIGFNLLLGILISAIITVFIPDSFFAMFTDRPLLEMLAVLIGAVPLYVCATASIPIAAALLIKGVSPGAALIFLMAGPATNAATITALGTKLGRKLVTIYLTVIVVCSLGFGALLNFANDQYQLNISRNVIERYSAITNTDSKVVDHCEPATAVSASQVDHSEHENHGNSPWSKVIVILFTIPLVLSLWKTKLKVPLLRLFKKKVSRDGAEIRIYSVGGMTCKNCAGHVTDAAKLLAGVADASVDLDRMELTVVGNIEQAVVQEAVNKAGYQFQEADRGTDIIRHFTVTGMTCKNCATHVLDAVLTLSDCDEPTVDLETTTLSISGIIGDDAVIAAVKNAGYTIVRN